MTFADNCSLIVATGVDGRRFGKAQSAGATSRSHDHDTDADVS